MGNVADISAECTTELWVFGRNLIDSQFGGRGVVSNSLGAGECNLEVSVTNECRNCDAPAIL